MLANDFFYAFKIPNVSRFILVTIVLSLPAEVLAAPDDARAETENPKEDSQADQSGNADTCNCSFDGYFEGYLRGEFKGTVKSAEAGKSPVAPEEKTVPFKPSRFILGVGPAMAKFDSNLRITNKSSGLSVFVDTEGTLGLPEYDSSPFFYTAIRIAEGHGIGLQYMDIRRKVNYLDVDKEYGDIGVKGEVSLVDDSNFYTLNYSYALHQDTRSYILATLGLSMIELKLDFLALGTIELGDNTLVESRYQEALSQWAPLPSIGMDFWWSYTKNWSVGTKIAVTGGSYQNISGAAFESVIRTRYRLSKHTGLVMGLHHTQADIDIDEEDTLASVGYAFTGAYLGFDYRI